jgi:NUMOD4 motif
MTAEQWLRIPGSDWYEISNRARVRSVDHVVVRSNGYRYTVRGRLRRIVVDRRDGLRSVALATGRRGHYVTVYPDRLVDQLFGDTTEALAA